MVRDISTISVKELARKQAKLREFVEELMMLDGLSRNRQARGDPGSGDMNTMLDELGRMIQEQQRLRDRDRGHGPGHRGGSRSSRGGP